MVRYFSAPATLKIDAVARFAAAAVALGLLLARAQQTVVQRPLAAVRGAVVLDLLGVDGGRAGVAADQRVHKSTTRQ